MGKHHTQTSTAQSKTWLWHFRVTALKTLRVRLRVPWPPRSWACSASQEAQSVDAWLTKGLKTSKRPPVRVTRTELQGVSQARRPEKQAPGETFRGGFCPFLVGHDSNDAWFKLLKVEGTQEVHQEAHVPQSCREWGRPCARFVLIVMFTRAHNGKTPASLDVCPLSGPTGNSASSWKNMRLLMICSSSTGPGVQGRAAFVRSAQARSLRPSRQTNPTPILRPVRRLGSPSDPGSPGTFHPRRTPETDPRCGRPVFRPAMRSRPGEKTRRSNCETGVQLFFARQGIVQSIYQLRSHRHKNKRKERTTQLRLGVCGPSLLSSRISTTVVWLHCIQQISKSACSAQRINNRKSGLWLS